MSLYLTSALSPCRIAPDDVYCSYQLIKSLDGSESRLPRGRQRLDEQAAYAVAAWLQRADLNDSLGSYFNPPLTPDGLGIARIEGWILGVV